MNKLITSLSTKLTLPTFVVGVLFLLGVSLLSSHQSERSIERESFAIANNVQNTLIISSGTNAQTDNLQKTLKALTDLNNISRLLIINKDNEMVVADNIPKNIGKHASESLSPTLLNVYQRYQSSDSKQGYEITDDGFYHFEHIKLVNTQESRLQN
jgi:hypothetical protein